MTTTKTKKLPKQTFAGPVTWIKENPDHYTYELGDPLIATGFALRIKPKQIIWMLHSSESFDATFGEVRVVGGKATTLRAAREASEVEASKLIFDFFKIRFVKNEDKP